MSDVEKEKAVVAAESWLALLDEDDFEGSWQAAAEVFRGAVSAHVWEEEARNAYGRVGRPQSRVLDTADYKTELPGAPDGEYFIITFKTVFERKAAGVETVVPMKDSDGEWHVSGYWIR